MTKILDGKTVSQRIKAELSEEVKKLQKQNINPGLAVILVGDNPASKIYVNNKKKACEQTGIYSEVYTLPEDTTEKELLDLIDRLNHSEKISGILVQLPVPKHIDEEKLLMAIDYRKDVDAFHPVNVGKLMCSNQSFQPCTPAGIMELIAESGIDVSGKNCVVIGRSNIVGKPAAMLLLQQNATVTICHSKTQNLAEIVKKADIIIAAVGKPNFVTADMVSEGAVVIDVGINRLEDNKICGDVDFEGVSKLAAAITPVPGGVGPMTIAMLMKNTVTAAKLQNS